MKITFNQHSYKKIIVLLLLFVSGMSMAQDKKKELEAMRLRLQKEIRLINKLISKNTSKTKFIVEDVQSINHKIRVKRDLVKVMNQQTNLLTKQINTNIKKIGQLRDDLTKLKADYAEMIRKSYKSNSEQSRLMFLLSSESFLQAYKRVQYMKQYTDYRKKQGEAIVTRTQELQTLNKTYSDQKKEKEALIAENRKVQKELEKEKKLQNEMLAELRKDTNKYTAQVKKKQQQADEIDRQIDKIIRDAIASSNKKAGKNTSNKTFALTPEAKAIGNSFAANKGKHIWPVAEGTKVKGYGKYRDVVNPNVTRESNGVVIATNVAEPVRAVYKGEVTYMFTTNEGVKCVVIRHGSYITTYFGLQSVSVKTGDKVSKKQNIGTMYTNKSTGKTELKFTVFKNTTRLNPESWLYRM
ncbi:peptidoglycan DD-metalloendopeptidase family protein [Kordia algicida OT-1]|uniref:Possible membrane protein possible peptidase, M23/M37 family n=1 Tax=Kordia algicida OT-1 TaxID=391587 RepID=A9DT03_9FLAO|nr:peptidoglycan DD-metalloendopeptidase family protein [Kordia algicida]EDP97006.1 possible membrane protein; possible peptidase, M23/M37 family [Kordia algicida OT-1]